MTSNSNTFPTSYLGVGIQVTYDAYKQLTFLADGIGAFDNFVAAKEAIEKAQIAANRDKQVTPQTVAHAATSVPWNVDGPTYVDATDKPASIPDSDGILDK